MLRAVSSGQRLSFVERGVAPRPRSSNKMSRTASQAAMMRMDACEDRMRFTSTLMYATGRFSALARVVAVDRPGESIEAFAAQSLRHGTRIAEEAGTTALRRLAQLCDTRPTVYREPLRFERVRISNR
ncbi:MAG: hypothetical protein KC620_11495 [Myxococcales bacterium]|nr:hypothetical protein [Myxococcales bacterium]